MCVWAFVAQPKLEHVLTAHGDELDPRYHVVPVFTSFPQRFGPGGAWEKDGPRGRADKTRKLALEHGREDVTGTVWVDDCPSSSWPAGAAIKAVIAMEDAGLVAEGRGGEYSQSLRDWFFVRNQNTARRSVQLAVAEELDIPRGPLEARIDDGSALSALLEDQERRASLGLLGSPSYVFDGGRAILYGNFSESILTATVEELVRGLHPGGSDC